MSATIRPATASDLPEILAIVNHAIAHTTAIYDYEPRTLELQNEWFADKLAHKFPVIAAEYNGKTIGFASYGTFRVKAAYQFTVEHSVYVSDDFIGKGIGKLLLAELIQLAKSQNMHVMIGCIDAANAPSIAFHKKFGFKESGICREVGFKFGKWLDLQFMQLILKD